MAYTIQQDIVVPFNYVMNNSGLVAPFRQGHMHSTGNPRSSVQNERDYLAGHYNEANYSHLVGLTNGQVDIRQVMNINGGAYDVGGDWNWESAFAIELVEGTVTSQEDFNKVYPAYVWLARKLAQDSGIDLSIDNQNIDGIKSHWYASTTGHGSDHVDPIGFLEQWGISKEQFYYDIINGIDDDSAPTVATVTPAQTQQIADTSPIRAFQNAGNAFTAYGPFTADEIKQVNGIWQVINYNLAGGRYFDWTINGIPLDIVDNLTRGNSLPTQVGDILKFNSKNNNGTIDDYDNNSNAVGVKYGIYGEVWFNADAFLKL
ncbi:lytic exoenzyme target recognition domain-containing protein [Leuconostoc citreum]